MFKVVYFRYGKRYISEKETIQAANEEFELIREYEVGFPDCILDQNNVIVRDGKEFVMGIEKINRVGLKYDLP